MLQSCKQPKFNGNTFGEAVEYAYLLKSELTICANRIEHLRQWVEKYQPKQE